ncbi:hypothetical protein BD414DRAFT_21955 [Trametes punicea]|nr:hypothetical protein BD414DRAFT_21955 [Trametes punicea]
MQDEPMVAKHGLYEELVKQNTAKRTLAGWTAIEGKQATVLEAYFNEYAAEEHRLLHLPPNTSHSLAESQATPSKELESETASSEGMKQGHPSDPASVGVKTGKHQQPEGDGEQLQPARTLGTANKAEPTPGVSPEHMSASAAQHTARVPQQRSATEPAAESDSPMYKRPKEVPRKGVDEVILLSDRQSMACNRH